jgi:hypothetical protein
MWLTLKERLGHRLREKCSAVQAVEEKKMDFLIDLLV